MALALNNLKRADMPLNKETKPNQMQLLLPGIKYYPKDFLKFSQQEFLPEYKSHFKKNFNKDSHK